MSEDLDRKNVAYTSIPDMTPEQFRALIDGRHIPSRRHIPEGFEIPFDRLQAQARNSDYISQRIFDESDDISQRITEMRNRIKTMPKNPDDISPESYPGGFTPRPEQPSLVSIMSGVVEIAMTLGRIARAVVLGKP